MNVFDVVRENITARQVAEYYGIHINRNGMACCPFHDNRHPSMKIDKRYFCFGCGEKGAAIDFVGKHFGLAPKDAAIKIADDFGFEYKMMRDKSIKKRLRKPEKSLEQKFREEQEYCYRVLSDYLHLLKKWKIEYAPKSMEYEWNPLFCEALHNIDCIEYLLNTLLHGDVRDRAFLVENQGKKVREIEKRIREANRDRKRIIADCIGGEPCTIDSGESKGNALKNGEGSR